MKHWFGPNSCKSKGNGHPIMFGKNPSLDFGAFKDGGGYPLRFMSFAYNVLGVTDPDKVVHLCSGSVTRGIRIDIRPEVNPTIVADCRKVPLSDGSCDWIMADPPYSREYAKNLYGTELFYPTPNEILKEASRLLRIGGRIGLLHFQVPMFRKPLNLIQVYGITTGLGYNIRAWSVLEKEGAIK